MKFPKRAKILLTALMLFALCAPVHAAESFECGYTVGEIEQFLIWYFSEDARYGVIRQDEETIVFQCDIDPEDVRYKMPKIRLPKRDPYDPREPEHWDYVPVIRAVSRIWATFHLNAQKKSIETRLQNAVIANPGSLFQDVVETDTADFHAACRYAQAYLDGGYGSGIATTFRRGHMYVSDVLDGSAAAAAGIETGDRIRLINKTVADEVGLVQFARKYQWAEWGKPFTLDLERQNGERYHVELQVDYIPAQTERLKTILGTDDVLPGATREEVYHTAKRYEMKQAQEQPADQTPQTLPYYALPFDLDDEGNVTKVEPNSLAEAAGMQVGDKIVAYNLASFSDMGAAKFRESAGKRLAAGQSVFLDLVRDGNKVSVTLKNTKK